MLLQALIFLLLRYGSGRALRRNHYGRGPDVIEAVKSNKDIFVLAAGGIATVQMAACMAMGAAGVWCGSVWLTTPEAETTPTVKENVRSKR